MGDMEPLGGGGLKAKDKETNGLLNPWKNWVGNSH